VEIGVIAAKAAIKGLTACISFRSRRSLSCTAQIPFFRTGDLLVPQAS